MALPHGTLMKYRDGTHSEHDNQRVYVTDLYYHPYMGPDRDGETLVYVARYDEYMWAKDCYLVPVQS
jgi:hypothetical protein